MKLSPFKIEKVVRVEYALRDAYGVLWAVCSSLEEAEQRKSNMESWEAEWQKKKSIGGAKA